MSVKKYNKGDRIFAKVRGYPAWPARVEELTNDSPNPKNARYKVFFYGTYQTGECKIEDMFDFAEKKEQFGTPKKQRGFNDAMREIEKNPEVQPPVIEDDSRSSDQSESETVDDKKQTPKQKKQGAKRAASKQTASSSSGSRKRVKMEHVVSPSNSLADAGDSSSVVATTPVNKTPAKKKSPSKSKTPVIALKTPKHIEEEEEEEDGEDFNEKFVFSDDDDGRESPSPVYSDLEPEDFNNGQYQMDDEESQLQDEINITISRREAINMLDDETLPDSLCSKIGNNLFTKIVKNYPALKQSRRAKLKFLQTELTLAIADKKFKQYLGCEKVGQTEKALVLLDKLEQVQFEPLMLKKQAKFVDTINKLRRYSGCVDQYELSPQAKTKFVDDAAKIREKAAAMFTKMLECFTVPEGVNFCEWFMDEARHIRRLVPSVPKFILMTEEPLVIDLEEEAGDREEAGPQLQIVSEEHQDGEEEDVEVNGQLCKEEMLDDDVEGVEMSPTMSRPPLQPLPINSDLNEQQTE